MVFGSDASGSGNSYCTPSRGCSTPASEMSEPPDFKQAYLSPCYFPTSDIEIPSVSFSRCIDIPLGDLALLYSFCHQSNLTPATVFKAGWLLLLQTYTGQDSVCFDILSPSKGNSALICCYDLASDQTVIEVLAHVQQQDYLLSQSNEDVTIAETLERLHLVQELLCNTAFSIQTGKAEHDKTQIRKYDMLLQVQQSVTNTSAILSYKCSAITESHARRVGTTFVTIMQSILESPKQSISSVQRLSLEDRQQILKWNEAPSPILDQCLHHAFAEKALDNPDSLAVCAPDGELTYGELDEASTRLAGYIDGFISATQKGAAMIPLCFERSKYAIITMLAILKTGSACVPLDVAATENDLQDKLLNVGAEIVCISASAFDKFATFKGEVVVVSDPLLDIANKNKRDRQPIDRRGKIAFVQYTKGSTGKPKAVIQSHAALYTGILAQGHSLGYDEDSRVLQWASYTSPVSISNIFCAFFYNACLILISEEQIHQDLADKIDNGITHACLTPRAARSLRSEELFHLTSLVLTGEPLESRDIEVWSYVTELIKAYGTAETSVLCTTSRSPSPNVFMPSNIGTPFAASAWIVDPQDVNRLLPIGCVGELVISGPTLASGYLNDDVATADAFITNPTWAGIDFRITQQRFFRTGDFAKYLETGELAFRGRKQAKTIERKKDE